MFDGIYDKTLLKSFHSKSNLIESFMEKLKFLPNNSSFTISSNLKCIESDHASGDDPRSDAESDGDNLFSTDDTVIVVNKRDLISDSEYLQYLAKQDSIHLISCENGEGMHSFLEFLTEKVKNM